MSTIFSKIIDGKIPSDFVYEDEHCKPIVNLDDLSDEDQALMGHIMLTIPKVAKQQGLAAGYRTIINTNKGGGQEIYHLHIHILGGGGPLPFA